MSKKGTKTNVEEVKAIFKELDKDGSGEVSLEEFKEGLKNLDDFDINFYYYICGGTKKKGLKVENFYRMEAIPGNFWELDDKEMNKVVFKVMDADNSGKIKYKEFKAIFKALGMDLSKEQMKKKFREADKDNSGSINFKEFEWAINHLD